MSAIEQVPPAGAPPDRVQFGLGEDGQPEIFNPSRGRRLAQFRARELAAELERIGHERLTELTWKLTGDLLHVAYAKELTAGAFISFDDENWLSLRPKASRQYIQPDLAIRWERGMRLFCCFPRAMD